jgi:xanthine dehydrogenase accessory factor
MRNWHHRLCARLTDGPVVMVTVMAVAGSVPREAGARMLVQGANSEGSIGGGQLEYQATAVAQALLRQGAPGAWHREVHRVVLGPDAGQCCGGVVEVLHEVFGATERAALANAGSRFVRPVTGGMPPLTDSGAARAQRPTFEVSHIAGERMVDDATVPWCERLTLYGAGHVARALIPTLTALPFNVSWVDIADARFPLDGTTGETRIVCDDPPRIAAAADAGGIHLVMTHAHDIDFAICTALLRREDFKFLGLIGSATKRARFVQRFRREGVAETAIERLVCPIGDPRIFGKRPAVIAVSIAAQLLQFREHEA